MSRFLALGLSILTATSRPGEDPCPVCGTPRWSGACSACGTYTCRDCKKLHLGDATDPCPGGGVEPPAERSE